jgi:hypothetical protein
LRIDDQAQPQPTAEEGMMNDSDRFVGRPRRAWRPTARVAAAIIATAGLALLAAACGGGNGSGSRGVANVGSSTSASSAASSLASNGPLAYSRCMRSRGVPNFPDPSGSGAVPKETAQQLGVSSSRYQTAQTACAHLLPNSGGVSQADIQQMMSGMRNFAGCMRSRGVSNWPDPSTDRTGYPVFYLQRRIDASAPQIVTKIHTCQHRLPQSGSLSIPGGVAMCPGGRPGPDATSACGGPHQGGAG